ncbi:MAG: ATP-binding cassette domain-containing protein [Clostridia bacterium]|nr:ATP-binding cassette domain-containing protein [Clostridia bacterium]
MLKINNVVKIFNKNTINQKIALNGIDLELEEGDFVTVIGGNGAGKSTLLNVIAGVFSPDEGKIILDGKDITNVPEHKRSADVARVFQDPMKGTAAEMNVEENVAIAKMRGKKRGLGWNVTKEDKKKFKELVSQLDLGLENYMSQKVSLLSGGQRQALTLLMATINKPKLLLLDEHTAALDPKTAEKVLEITSKVTQNQTTVMITHNMKDALRFGNKIIMMNEGKIVFSASGEEKKKLTVNALLEKFAIVGNQTDRVLLS